ncbi:MAG TPA: Fic family protein [Patescibacteria group bacterium]|nr:Fic family protein [Patescibacteria group bacterium]
MFDPTYRITNNLLKYIGRIEACKEIIYNSPLVPAWEAKFREDARVRTIHFGTRIEGNDLTKEQASLLIQSEEGTAPATVVGESVGISARERDIQEVLNYRNVMNWIDEWGGYNTRKIEYSEHLLKTLHTLTTKNILPPEQVGQYRTQQVVIRSATDGQVVFRPPIHLEIPTYIQNLMLWLNDPQAQEIHPVLRAGMAHYELVRIHPFIEGNGRTARAFSLLVLYAEGYDVKKLFSIEEYFDKDIDGYYKAILSVQQSETTDMTYWLEYFCFGLAVELDRVKAQVLKLSQDAKLKDKLGGVQIALTERQIAILELLQEKKSATTTEVNKILPLISQDTILRDLKDMMQKGLLKKEGVTKGVVYYLNER